MDGEEPVEDMDASKPDILLPVALARMLGGVPEREFACFPVAGDALPAPRGPRGVDVGDGLVEEDASDDASTITFFFFSRVV